MHTSEFHDLNVSPAENMTQLHELNNFSFIHNVLYLTSKYYYGIMELWSTCLLSDVAFCPTVILRQYFYSEVKQSAYCPLLQSIYYFILFINILAVCSTVIFETDCTKLLYAGCHIEYFSVNEMKERVSKLTYPTLQHCLRMLYTMNGNSKHQQQAIRL